MVGIKMWKILGEEEEKRIEGWRETDRPTEIETTQKIMNKTIKYQKKQSQENLSK